jgi:HD-GYP domain-containing protein (c-di-GMP phosphodiesterase class II)
MELAPDISPDDIELFLQEADEQLQLLDEDFVKLENEADSAELLQEIFRAAHTLKGSCAMLGYREMADLAHVMEAVLDQLRNGTLTVRTEVVDALLHELLVKALSKPLVSMAREFFPDCVGEPNVAGTTRQEDYATVRPVKVASMALLLARKTGSTMLQLADLGMAAALMDVGTVLLSEANLARFDPIQGPMAGKLDPSTRLHPAAGAALAQTSKLITPEAVRGIAEHHERWDGSGYPNGLKGEGISRYGRILAITDAYFDLVSTHAGHKALAPNQAAEYIMAYSGELFDPALVQVFMHEVPLYPNGVTVRLSTGEVGIIADVNVGYVGRPIVRVVSDDRGRNISRPYNMDLADPENQGRLIVQVMDY